MLLGLLALGLLQAPADPLAAARGRAAVGAWGEARAELRAACAELPDDDEVAPAAARLAASLLDPALELALWERADHADLDARLGRARALVALGRDSEARPLLEALVAEPGAAAAEHRIAARLTLAGVLRELEDVEPAAAQVSAAERELDAARRAGPLGIEADLRRWQLDPEAGLAELEPVLAWHRAHPEADPRARLSASFHEVFELCLAGRTPEARTRFDELWPELRDRAAADPLLAAMSVVTRGMVLYFEGDGAGARDALASAERALTQLLAPRDRRLAIARNNLGVACQAVGDADGVVRAQRGVVDALERRLAATDEELLDARRDLVASLTDLGDHAGAAEQEERVLAAAEVLYAEDDPRLHYARVNLATSRWGLGERERAVAAIRAGRIALERLLPVTDENLEGAVRTETRCLLQLDRPSEAVDVVRPFVERLAQEVDPLDDRLVDHRTLLVESLYRAGDGFAASEELERLMAPGLDRLRALGAERLLALGGRLLDAGREETAEAVLELALEARRARGDAEADLLDTELEIIGARISQGRALEVEARLRAIVAEVEARGEADLVRLGSASGKLGRCLQSQTRYAEAVEWNRRSVDALAAALRPTHPGLLISRLNLIESSFGAGDLEEAEEGIDLLAEAVAALDDGSPMHARVLAFRARLAHLRGRPAEARRLFLEADAALEDKLPPEHPFRTSLRVRLSMIIGSGGDAQTAATYAEENLNVLRLRYDDDHPRVLNAMADYAAILDQGEPAEQDLAIDLLERALRGLTPLRAEDSPNLMSVKANLAGRLRLRDGATDRVLELTREVLEARERTLPEGDPGLENIRSEHALILLERGDPGPARAQLRRAWDRSDPALASSWFTGKLRIGALARFGAAAEDELLGHCRELADGVQRGLAAERALRSQRELADLASAADGSAWTLDFASTLDGLSPSAREQLRRLAFTTREAVRGASGMLARSLRREADDPELARLRRELRSAAAELADLVFEGAADEVLYAARRGRDRIERRILERLASVAEHSHARSGLSVGELAAALGPEEAYVGWFESWRFGEERFEILQGPICAWVLRAGGRLDRVTLGDPGEVFWAAARWGTAVSASTSSASRGLAADDPADLPDERVLGEQLRRAIFDPLLPHLEGVRSLLLAPEQQLCGLPLDALPWEDGRLGDEWRTTTVSGLWELALAPPRAPAERDLVLFGSVDYDAGPERAGASGGFAALPATSREVEAIAALRRAADPEAETVRRTGGAATRGALEVLLPGSRFVHVATHAWFVERVAAPGREEEGLFRLTRHEDLSTSNPGVLSGLALAGANRPGTASTLTAEELSAFDLSACELAVLSACEGARGVVDPGVGYTSLQSALRLAGARTVVGAAWPVPDEPTRELMEAFYRGLWRQGLAPVDALWEAKRVLREKRGRDGLPLHPPSHWAAWIVAGRAD